jgi:hypothetical protein
MAIAPDDVCRKTILVRQRGDGHIAEKLEKYREIDGCQFSTILLQNNSLYFFWQTALKHLKHCVIVRPMAETGFHFCWNSPSR